MSEKQQWKTLLERWANNDVCPLEDPDYRPHGNARSNEEDGSSTDSSDEENPGQSWCLQLYDSFNRLYFTLPPVGL